MWKTISETFKHIEERITSAYERLWHAGWAIPFIAISILLLGLWAAVSLAHADSPSEPKACPGSHVSDFLSEGKKAGLQPQAMNGQHLKDFFVLHGIYTGASPKVLDLRPTSGVIFYAPEGVKAGAALVVYFDDRGCYLASNKTSLKVLEFIKNEVDRHNV